MEDTSASQLTEVAPLTTTTVGQDSLSASSKRLEELSATRKNTRTPKSPLKMGGILAIDALRENPPSIWARDHPPPPS